MEEKLEKPKIKMAQNIHKAARPKIRSRLHTLLPLQAHMQDEFSPRWPTPWGQQVLMPRGTWLPGNRFLVTFYTPHCHTMGTGKWHCRAAIMCGHVWWGSADSSYPGTVAIDRQSVVDCREGQNYWWPDEVLSAELTLGVHEHDTIHPVTLHGGLKCGQWIRNRQQRDAGYHIPRVCCNPSLRGCCSRFDGAPTNSDAQKVQFSQMEKNQHQPNKKAKETHTFGHSLVILVGSKQCWKLILTAALLCKYGLILMSVH